MKAITLWQPWAQLVVYGFKRLETRSWSTKHRGDVAIHAAARESEWSDEEMLQRLTLAFPNHARFPGAPYDEQLRPRELWRTDDVGVLPHLGLAKAQMQTGSIIGVARLDTCQQSDGPDDWPWPECVFGDLQPGRWAWAFGHLRRLETPVPVRGAQQLWDVPPKALAQIARSGVSWEWERPQ